MEQEQESDEIRIIVRRIFMFMEAFAKFNNDNTNIILIFYNSFEQYIGYGLGAMRCLIGLIQNN